MSLPRRDERIARRASGVGRKVLHVITRLDRGGSADNTLLTCLGLDDLGWNVTLVHGPHEDPSPLLDPVRFRPGIRRVLLPNLVRSISPLDDLQAFFALRRLAREEVYDVVHTHSSKAGILGRRAWRGRSARLVHTPHGHVFHGYLSPMATRLAMALEKRAAAWCDRIVVLTDRGREEHLQARVGVREQFVTIRSGIDLDRFRGAKRLRKATRLALGIPYTARVVGSVARLVEIKGLVHLVRAAAELAGRDPDLWLLLVGDGDQRVRLEEEVASGPLAGRTVFTGALPDPRPSLGAMDVFVLPSLNEGQGRAAVEAMAAGIPVVASDVGGLPEVLDHGEAGLLVPPANPAALAASMERLLDDPGHAAALARNASRRVAEGFDQASMIDAIETMYLTLLEGGGVGR